VGDEAFCPQCGATQAAGAALCGGCGRQWDARRATSTRSAEAAPGSTRVKRGLILVGLYFLTIPGWVIGGYLILKWTGLIRGMSHENELAAGWVGVAPSSSRATSSGLVESPQSRRFLPSTHNSPGLT
jgi:hypothetical protein